MIAAGLDLDLDQAVIGPHLVPLDRTFGRGETFACTYVKSPIVQRAFDDMAEQGRICQRIRFVRAKIFDGEKFTADIE